MMRMGIEGRVIVHGDGGSRLEDRTYLTTEFNLTQHQEAKHQKAAPTVRASHGAFYCCEVSPRRTSFGATLMATSEQPSPC
ncbi:hypothetical protein HYQ46_000679 [Verticillium longisporum]|nr:hypothetical protein HYQ46_000679 [Verticillium longisporum]